MPESLEAPAFNFLSSIVAEDGKWSLWINESKIRQEQKVNPMNLDILKVTGEYIVAMWQTDYLDEVSPNFRSRLNFINISDRNLNGEYSWDYKSQDGDIHVDSSRGLIKFKLENGE